MKEEYSEAERALIEDIFELVEAQECCQVEIAGLYSRTEAELLTLKDQLITIK